MSNSIQYVRKAITFETIICFNFIRKKSGSKIIRKWLEKNYVRKQVMLKK